MRTSRNCMQSITGAVTVAVAILALVGGGRAAVKEPPAAQDSERAWLDAAMSTVWRVGDASGGETLFSEVIAAHARFGDIDVARRVVEGLEKDAKPEDKQKVLRLIATIAAGQAERGDTGAAKQFAQSLDNAVKEGSPRWSVAFALARSGDIDGALQVLDAAGAAEAELIEAKVELAKSLARWGEPTSVADLAIATAIANTLRDQEKKDSVLQEVMMEHLSAGRVDEAMRSADMSDDPAAMKFLSLFFRPEMFVQMDKALKIEIVTTGSGRFLEKITAEVPDWENDPNGRALVGATRMMARVAAGDAGAARQEAESIADIAERDMVLGMISMAQTLMGDIEAAKQTIESVSKATDREDLVRLMAVAQATAGDLAAAQQMADAITDEDKRRGALEAIARFQARGGDVSRALATVKSISPGNLSPLDDIVDILLESGDTAGAIEAAEAMGNNRAEPLTRISRAQMKAGDAAMARMTARAAHQAMPDNPSARTINEVAEALAYVDDLERASAIVDALPNPLDKGYAQVAVAKGIAQRNQEIVAQLREAAENGDARAQCDLAVMYANGTGVPRDYDQAAAWFAKSAAQGYAPAEAGRKAAEIQALKDQAAKADAEIAKATAKIAKAQELQGIQEKLEQINELERDPQAGGAQNVDTWPPPDIKFESAAEWDRAYRAATFLDADDFLQRVKGVRLTVNLQGNAQADYGATIEAAAVEAIRASGLELDPSSTVNLVLDIDLAITTGTLTRGNGEVERRTLRVMIVSAHFYVSARSLRHGEFYHVRGAPASNWHMMAGVGAEDNLVRENLVEAFGAVVAGLRQTDEHQDDPAEWQRTLWSPEQAEDMFRKYTRARRHDPRLMQRLADGVRQFRDVHVSLMAKAERFSDEQNTKAAWIAAATDAGFGIDAGSKVWLRVIAAAAWNGPRDLADHLLTSKAGDFWALYNGLDIGEYDVVYELDGQLFRSHLTLDRPGFANFAGSDDGGQILRNGDVQLRNSFFDAVKRSP